MTTDLEAAVKSLTTDFTVYETTFKVLRDVHKREEDCCAACGGEFPCKTVRVLDNAKHVLSLSEMQTR